MNIIPPTSAMDTLRQRADADIPALLFPFRRYRIFSRQFARYILVIVASVLFGALSTSTQENLHKPRFLKFMAVYLTIIAAVFIARRIYMEKRGGISPVRLEKDALVMPAHAHSLKIITVPYEDILSVYARGKKNRVIVIDTKKRTFAFALREFAEADAEHNILAGLRERIDAHPQSATVRQAMEGRQAAANHLLAIKPRVTQVILALICLVFAAQCLFTNDNDLFSLLDLGANASILTLNGEWFRLITANLLHANFMHIFNNALFILIVGTLAERLLGWRRFLLVALATGILSQLTSALWHQMTSASALFSVGVSGVLFGILGALAIVSRRFRHQMPGGFRLNKRFWWLVLGVNLLATPIIFPEVDTACHLGGLLSGLAVGWLVCRKQDSLLEAPRFGPVSMLALAVLALIWCAGLLTEAEILFYPAAREASRETFTKAILGSSEPNPEIDNELAWSIATEPSPTKGQLDDALALAKRSVEMATQSEKVSRHDRLGSIDTLATVYYRRGDVEKAIDTEEPLLDYPDSHFASQLARFLNAYRQTHGAQLINASAELSPKVELHASDVADRWTFDIAIPQTLPDGGQIFALLMQKDRLLGMLHVSVPPNATLIHYTDWSIDTQSVTFPYDTQANPPRLVLAQYDRQGCDCNESNGSRAWFYIYDKDIAVLP